QKLRHRDEGWNNQRCRLPTGRRCVIEKVFLSKHWWNFGGRDRGSSHGSGRIWTPAQSRRVLEARKPAGGFGRSRVQRRRLASVVIVSASKRNECSISHCCSEPREQALQGGQSTSGGNSTFHCSSLDRSASRIGVYVSLYLLRDRCLLRS